MPNSQLCPQDLLFKLALTTRVAQSPHLARKVERRGWELLLLLLFFKPKNKTKQKFLEHPAQQMQFSRPLHTLTRAGQALAPGAAPSPRGARRPPQGTLTWHLLLSVQVVAVFTWVFK